MPGGFIIEKKDNEKKRKLEEKEERQRKRNEKKTRKKMREALKQKRSKVSSDSSEDEEGWIDSGDSLDDVDIIGEANDQVFFDLGDSKNISVGDYVLGKFYGGKRNATIFRYICVIQNIYNDQDVEVMCMKSINKDKNIFVFDEKDVSCIKKKLHFGSPAYS